MVVLEPRAAYTCSDGTLPCRSPRFCTFCLNSAAEVNALTAIGTSCRVSSRLRAVTVTASSFFASAGCAGGSACCARTGAAQATPNAMPMARLMYVRFMSPLMV